MIHFYKPTPKNTGSACSFFLTDKNDLFFSILKQSSWDPVKKIGSFKKSKEDANSVIFGKFNMVEAAKLISCIEKNQKFETVHSTKSQKISITFEPYFRFDAATSKTTEEQLGFSFRVIRSREGEEKGTSFRIGLNFGEADYLKYFLLYVMNKSFDKEASEESSTQENETQG